jgi:hypothetical protein
MLPPTSIAIPSAPPEVIATSERSPSRPSSSMIGNR